MSTCIPAVTSCHIIKKNNLLSIERLLDESRYVSRYSASLISGTIRLVLTDLSLGPTAYWHWARHQRLLPLTPTWVLDPVLGRVPRPSQRLSRDLIAFPESSNVTQRHSHPVLHDSKPYLVFRLLDPVLGRVPRPSQRLSRDLIAFPPISLGSTEHGLHTEAVTWFGH